MSSRQRDQRDASLRPRELLRSAESSAVRSRKLLRAHEARTKASEPSGSMHDAVRLAGLIERLAHYGQTAPAEESMRVAEYVDQMIDLLIVELHEFLA